MNKNFLKIFWVLGFVFLFGYGFSVQPVKAESGLILEITKECDIQYSGDSCVADLKLANNTGKVLDGEASLHIDYVNTGHINENDCKSGLFDGKGINAQYSVGNDNWLSFSDNWDDGITKVSGFKIAKNETQPKLEIKTAPNLCPGEYTFTLALKGTVEGKEYTTPPVVIGGGGGGTLLPPGLMIKYEKPFVVGTTTAKIVWTTSHQATSRVIYGTEPGVFDLNNSPNYGYQFSTLEQDTPANPNGVVSHQILLTNLQPDTTYYYRCISHGSPLTISQEHGFTTLAIKKTFAGGQEIHQTLSQENKLNQNKNNQQNTELKNETNLSNNNLIAGKNSESGANNPTSTSKLKLTPNQSSTPLSTTTKTNKPRFNPFLASIGSALTLGTNKTGVGIFVGLTILALIISIVWWKKKK